MRFHTYPPRLLTLSLSDPMSRLVGKIASLAGLQVVHASRLWDVKFFENQRGIVIVILEVRECCDTFRIIAEVQEQIPNAPLIIITEPDQNGQDQLALRLGARYVIRKPCHPVELDRLFRFILENYADEGDCWEAMKQEAAKQKATSLFSSSAIKEDLKTNGFLTLEEIKRRAIIATVNLANGDKLRAAKMLGVGKNTVYRAFQENGYKKHEETVIAREGLDSAMAEGAD
jgi:DNA-binding NtrC family response regulator